MSPLPHPDFDIEELAPGEDPSAAVEPLPADKWVKPIDWAIFWASESPAEDWLLEPIVAAGRQTAIYSKAKIGKSLLALDIAAAGATGRSVLGYPARDPIVILYVDLEMTEADLRERLTDLGYGPDDDLSRLHYYQLPNWPSLDGEIGGEILTSLAIARGAALVVVDTMARAVAGEENSADTYRNFYRHTGRILKAAGVALLRLDHQGKDDAQGQRGSSAKDDDLDVVFRLTQLDARTLELTRTRSRIPWVAAKLSIVRHEEPVLCHLVSADAVPAGTFDCITALDELDVPLDATAATALATLRRADRGARKQVVLAALKHRRAVAK
jgi:hypothetical protein